jgi:hypothetical protein
MMQLDTAMFGEFGNSEADSGFVHKCPGGQGCGSPSQTRSSGAGAKPEQPVCRQIQGGIRDFFRLFSSVPTLIALLLYVPLFSAHIADMATS